MDERFSDNLVFQIIKQFFVDAALDLLTGKAAPGFEAEELLGRLLNCNKYLICAFLL